MVYGNKYEKVSSPRYDELNRRNEIAKQNPQAIDIYMPQENPDIRKILSRNGFNPDLPPGDIGLNKYYIRESIELHPDKIGNPSFTKYKNINEKSRENKLFQLNNDKDILRNAGYSFGKSSFGKSSFGESLFINKTKTFLKNLGSGIWK